MIVLTYIVLTLACAVVLYPLAWIVKIALTGDVGASFFAAPVSAAPLHELFAGGFPRALANSLVLALASTVVGLVFATTGAFAFSRMRFAGRRASLQALLFTQMFPGILLSVPLYLLLNAVHLLGSLFGLVLVYATVSVPFSIWMLKGYFDNVPIELEESARLDGATDWQLFRYIMLPLIRPGLAVTALYAFMGAWNEYILAATFLTREDRYPAPVVLKNLVGSFSTAWGPFALGSIVVSLPVMAVFFALQRHLVSGLMAGAVKE